ncbi:hypothetical protein M3152_11720 [Sporosarcina luteola]|uniref:hypothetical protein n=1 Tax=Sporosarcina luteola TaxID=582850 RepID=UPI00203B235A|nr:hypothetical protein [Sporosarcina luteola]MCM3638367.1 hypothetical protein [Sporosarcina luteola]
MEKKLQLLIFALVLVLGLAACGNDKGGDSANTTADSETETKTEEAGGADPNAKEDEAGEETADDAEAENNLQNDQTIGLSMDKFKDKFNEHAAAQGLDYKIEKFEWLDQEDGTQTATIELHDDLRINGLSTGEEDELKAILLEVEGFESRQTAFDIVNVIIKSVGNVADEDAKTIMNELGLKDPNEDGNDTETYVDHNGLKYLLINERSNYFEFGIANQNDPDLIAD